MTQSPTDNAVARWVHTTNTAYPNMLSDTPEPVELPVIPNRMGGRYAQTPCHPNGQPHAPGFVPKSPKDKPRAPTPAKHYKPARPVPAHHAPNPSEGIMGPTHPPPSEMRKIIASQEYARLMGAAAPATRACPACVHDIKMVALQRMVMQLGPAYAQYAHGIRPQLPSPPPEPTNDSLQLLKIPFVPKPLEDAPPGVVQLGVSLAELIDFCDVLEGPEDKVLEPMRLIDGSFAKIYLAMEHPGYPPVLKEITGNCAHRPVTRFSLAYSVAETYSTYFTTNPFSLPRGAPAPANTIVVRSFVNLRLVHLYTTDRITYRAHVAYVF
ncbi:hypothetical protein MKEN_00572500 [Mycena kentingensis (nom. inval.)]|nr:hypothetical protein MKEN_00572500 [Mycena kentingensis (nom. inval.)]